METVIIALSGRKGAGKNTIAVSIRDHFVRRYKGSRIFDFCKEYAFADLLKNFCIDVLGLDHQQCYGSDDDKETATKYMWEDTPAFKFYPLSDSKGEPSGPMTARDVMQRFGTDCVRTWFGNVWAEATLRLIKKEKPILAIITDNRFPSEVETILGYNRGFIIRLTRSPFSGDGHASETSLDDFDWNKDRCYILDNSNLSTQEQSDRVSSILDDIFLKVGV